MMYSVVIPVYNEKDNLFNLQKELEEVLESLNSNYEIIYVDDGSSDGSLEVLKKIKNNSENIKIISFKKNRGQSVALFFGFLNSSGDWIITLDSDGQNPPKEIVKLLKYKDEFDFITGIRKNRKDSFFRKFSSKVAYFFRFIFLKDTTKDIGCSLRLFKRDIINFIPFFKNFHRFFTFLVVVAGFKVKEVYVEHRERRFGRSRYKTIKRLLDGIFDLIGVFWLKKRLIKYEIKYKF